MRLPGLRGLSPLEVGKRLVREIVEDDCAGQAAQLAYYFLFSLFPLLLFLVTLVGYLPVPDLFDRTMAWLGEVLPPDALSLVRDNVETIATQQRGGLLSLGVIFALWGASAGFRAIMSALNRAYDVQEGRPLWKYYGVSLLMTLVLSVLAITAFALLIFGPQIGHWLAGLVGLGGTFDLAWSVLRWPVALVLLILVLAVVYYVAPDVEQEWRWVTPGSAVAVVGWVAASVAFSYYVQSFGSYDQTYGSLGAVIVLLLWLYLTGFMLLFGGEMNAVIEHLAPERKRPGAKEQEDTGHAPPEAGGAVQAQGPRPRSEHGDRRMGADRRGGNDRRIGVAGVWPAPGHSALLPVPAEHRRRERRQRERRGGAGSHLTLVRRPAPEPAGPDGGGPAGAPLVGAVPSGPQPGAALAAGGRPVACLPPDELLHELTSGARRLVGLHARLLPLGLRALARRVAVGAARLAAGLVVASVALLFLLAPLFTLLALAMPSWAAAAIVAVGALAVGAAAIRIGLGQARSSLAAPRRAVAAVRAEAGWLRSLLRG